jgi:hypothetical protein
MYTSNFCKKLFLTFTFFLILIIVAFQNTSNDDSESLRELIGQRKNLQNLNYFSFDGSYHPGNVIFEENKLKSAKNSIFFVESHLNRDRVIDKPRVACSIESAGGF